MPRTPDDDEEEMRRLDERDALLSSCQLEIELAWNERMDDSPVHRLAEAHPELKDELFDFFKDVVEAEDNQDRYLPERAAMDIRVREMLRKVIEDRGANGRPFLGLLREAANEPVQAIADSMDVTADFLIEISENGKVLPFRARAELVRRAAMERGIDKVEALASFDVVSVRRAASRDGAYEPPDLTYEKIINKSKLSAAQKKFWLTLD